MVGEAYALFKRLERNKIGTATTDRIADSAVTSAKIAEDTILGVDVADDAIGSAEIADNAVITARIENSAITNPKLAASGLDINKMTVGTIDSLDRILAITNEKLAGGITSDKISALPGTAGDVFSPISPGSIASNAITNVKLAGSVTSDKILALAGTPITSPLGTADLSTPGRIKPYAGDETVVAGTSSTYVSEKEFRFLKHSDIFMPEFYAFAAEIKSTGGTATLGVAITDATLGTIENSTEVTNYNVVVGSINISSLASGSFYRTEAFMKVSRGTYDIRSWDNWVY